MTKQEYYDLLVRSARDGTFPSYNGSSCRYRLNQHASCKQRCAIGLLIDDENYDKTIEGLGIYNSEIEKVVKYPEGLIRSDLCDVQAIHDDLSKRELWSASVFVRELNTLSCFADVIQTVE